MRRRRPRRSFPPPSMWRHGVSSAAVVISLSLFCPMLAVPTDAAPRCAQGVQGWCVARRIVGEAAGGELGFRFGEPLDVDGDSHADIAAGSRFALAPGDHQNGQAAVWSGATGARIRAWDGPAVDGLFGHSVLPVPDLDGDTLADLVIAAPNARIDGELRGILVAKSAKSGDEIWRREGGEGGNFGWDLAPAGDQNGDGRADVFVGRPSNDAGRAYLISGRDGSVLHEYGPARPTATFGWFVARVDDLDGDEKADIVVGAHLEDDGSGRLVGGAYAISASSGRELHHWRGTEHLSGFGEVVASIDDLDGDGKQEVVIAAPRTNEHSRTHAGEVLVYSGGTGRLLWRWAGRQPGELFGRMVVGAGDVDGDGAEDVAVGAPWYADPRPDAEAETARSGERTGRVELRSGRTGSVLYELVGDGTQSWFGWHIRRAPDPERRGRPTLLVASLRQAVDGHDGTGVLDLYVLDRPDVAGGAAAPSDQGTITRGERRSDIK